MRRQLRKAGASADVLPDFAGWQLLLARINRHYRASDEDRYTLERSLDVSGREMAGLHERVSAERAQLEALVASLPQGVLVVDAEGVVHLTNRALRQMVGGDPANLDEMVLFNGAGEPCTIGRCGTSDELWLLGSSGRRAVELDQVPLADGRVLWTVTDLTERLVQRNALKKARLEAVVAQRAEKARADFLARMSHELRTPLNAILGYSELLGDDIDDPQSLSDLDRIHKAGEHLLGLINDVLDLSKVDAGRMEARMATVNVDELIASTLDDLRPLCREGVVLRRVGPPVGPLTTDSTRLRQILYNLLSNAVRYTDEGSVELEVRREAHRLHLIVRDTGCGIAADELPGLFEPFQQASGARGGTGLGLALVQSLAELLGGRCLAKSEVGVGSEFTLDIPYRPVQVNSQVG